MEECDDKQMKIEALRRHFSPMIGKELSRIETAQTKIDGKWEHWFDLPVRLYFGHDILVAIAWSHLDKLFISNDNTLNFPTDGCEVRWVSDKIEAILPALSGKLKSVMLGLGDFKVDDQQIEIWTRVVLEQDNGWLEVFNGLDENAFRFHQEMPAGEFVTCC